MYGEENNYVYNPRYHKTKTCQQQVFLFLNFFKNLNFDKVCVRKFLSVQLIFATAII